MTLALVRLEQVWIKRLMSMLNTISYSANALFLSLMTRQVTPWQAVCQQPKISGRSWADISNLLFSKILEPMWWCCRGPVPVTLVQKESLYWLAKLTQEPTPVAGRIWVAVVKSRYLMLPSIDCDSSELDAFLLRCFQDFSLIDEIYKKGGWGNGKN